MARFVVVVTSVLSLTDLSTLVRLTDAFLKRSSASQMFVVDLVDSIGVDGGIGARTLMLSQDLPSSNEQIHWT